MSDQPKQKIELRELLVAVKDVTEWYVLGVHLSLPVYMLDTIKVERHSVQESMGEMLKKWLDYDPEASWEKLASALEAIGKRAVAEDVRSQFVRSLTSVVAVRAKTMDADDATTRVAMTENILTEIKSDFSLLLIEVQSSLEECKVKAKIVRKFLYNLFEGECDIPNVSDMDEVFDSVTKAKLWRFDHYGPLKVLAEKCLPNDDSARVKIAEYIRQLSAYYATTSILDHLQASDQDDPEEDNQLISPKKYNRQYRKLTVKVKVDPSVKMEYVEKLWQSLMTEFNIPELTAIVDLIEKGSLTITWLILPHLVTKIRATLFKSVDFFQRNNIIEIELYGGDLTVPLYLEEWMEGSTPLYRASFAGDIEEVKALLHKGTEDINQQNDNADGHTPLIGACFGSGDVNIVRLLLEKGAGVDALDKCGRSALMFASGYAHIDVVKLLLEYKADVNLHNDAGVTALIMACAFGNTDTVTVLLDHGAVVDHRDKDDELTPLMWASKYGQDDTARALLEKGATVDIKDNNYGQTALMYASEHGHADTARALLEKGATVDIKDVDGHTALWYAIDGDHPETVKVLLEFVTKVDLPFDYENGGTALTVASRQGHAETVKVLLSHGASVDYQDNHGQTPLHHASVRGRVDTVTVLLEKGAKVDLQNEDGWTALLLAAKQGKDKMVKTLLDHGANVNMKSKAGLTALDIARAESRRAVCKVIEQHLNQGAKVEPQQAGGQEDSESQDQVGESGQDPKTELTETGGQDSESQDQVGESGQDPKTELTEEQRSEVRSVSERLWYQFKRVFLRGVMEKKERTGQLQGDPSPRITDQSKGRRYQSPRITDQPKGRKSILNLFNRPGRRRRRQTQGQVVGTAPAPERHQ